MLRSLKSITESRRAEVLTELDYAASPTFDFFLLIVLSCCIATFGLIADSPAIIIGAMLVAPLMSPILGLSLASVAGRGVMFRRSLVALLEGALFAVILALAFTVVAKTLPFGALDELPSEVLSRTHPSPFDLVVALAGGAAASFALAQPNLSAALPGVAIATALMPPLCVVGLGVAVGRHDVWLGALLLFATNFVAISFAGIVVFALLGFRAFRDTIRSELYVSGILVLLVAIALVTLTTRSVTQAQTEREVHDTIVKQLDTLPDAQLVGLATSDDGQVLRLNATVRTSREPTHAEVVALQSNIAQALQRTVALVLTDVPTIKLDPLVAPTRVPAATALGAAPSTVVPTVAPIPTIVPAASPTTTPTLAPSATATPAWQVYVVQDGDTLAALAQRFQVPLSVLVEVNHLIDPNVIEAGRALLIPPAVPRD